jgi:hypothetical protein
LEEAADQLFGSEAQEPPTAAVAVVLVGQHDGVPLHPEQPLVGEGDAVSVAGEIFEHSLRTGEGWLAVDHPLPVVELIEEALEGLGIRETLHLSDPGELAGGSGGLEARQVLATKDPGQHPYRQQILAARSDPAIPRWRQASSRHDAMDVWVMGQLLAPGVEHRQHAQSSSQVLGVLGYLEKRLDSAAKQQVVERLRIAKR